MNMEYVVLILLISAFVGFVMFLLSCFESVEREEKERKLKMIDDLFRNVEIKIIFRDVPGNGSAPIKDVSDLEPQAKPRTSASARRAMEWGIEED